MYHTYTMHASFIFSNAVITLTTIVYFMYMYVVLLSFDSSAQYSIILCIPIQYLMLQVYMYITSYPGLPAHTL